ncbi:hypothetical protein FOPG_17194 [Fusarium oxysporum f. sp. conglutinans race 2 54008]|uniref:WW domain-containing oxidoreductase n=3 Tax=Fusarium oxysporum f. sp. conglutinans TaxID=100902 RepID=A0A8H6GVU4_FUSOX|nr:hypothetical protein FOXB_00703 [Fusarium oxysporum f. sp. conglutinans Fo5176]EXL66656.1 hypothetical protein FOPG_17194 [Fusarium oxysporum f. sp. conglutinans race 2 54008]KAF6524601.1 hypothetical protein HZS61_013100 [Fusarium oxysporum f. sp. conglutinans]KAG6983929.1 Retinol dehydrogenase 12 [Fusarium oxysporum f. sp. conglutinans]KAI8409283.1 hypothetical protein FOFC_09119 [Fusarium oxysporum]
MAFTAYAEEYLRPNGPSDARPTALRVVRDLKLDGKLEGRVFVVTGGTSGIGYQVARAIHATGADLYITGRDSKKGESVATELAEDGRPGRVVFVQIELDSLASVRDGAAEILEKSGGKVNVLINNAGIMMCPYEKTKDGFESQFGINHLGHFQLFYKLKSALLSSATAEYASRVVNLTSSGHRLAPLDTDDYNITKDYTPFKGYGASKTANIYFSNEIERRYGSQHLNAYSTHPGMTITNIGQYLDPETAKAFSTFPGAKQITKEAAQGAAVPVLAALSQELEGKGGLYLEDCRQSGRAEGVNPIEHPYGYASWIEDEDSQRKLWIDSLALVGSKDD